MKRTIFLSVVLSALAIGIPERASAQREFSSPNLPGDTFRRLTGVTEDYSAPSFLGGGTGLGIDIRAGVAVVVDAFFDSGRVLSEPPGLFPSEIALDGTAAARERGRFDMFATGSLLDFSATLTNFEGEPEARAQFDVLGGNPRLRLATASVVLPDNANLSGGQDWSTFADYKAQPYSIINDGTPAGAIFRRQAQIRYTQAYESGLSLSVAIERPTSDDFELQDPDDPALPMDTFDVRLQRYPDLVARVRWESLFDAITTLQLATLIRGFGVENAIGAEQIATGWGVAGTARFRLFGSDHNIQLGVVGGEGIGRYLYGFGAATDVAAGGPNAAGMLTAVPNVGAFCGYQHVWSEALISNVAYGYAYADLPAITAGNGSTTTRTQNAWTNLVYKASDRFYIGLEYHYGLLEVNRGTEGDNSRIQLTLTLLEGS